MAKVHFITQGCSANQADSEIMQGILQKCGHELTDEENDADAIVFNTCTVKGPTESFFRKKLADLHGRRKKVIIAGCIPQSEKDKHGFQQHSLIGTFQIDKIASAVDTTLEGGIVSFLARENKSRLAFPKIRKSPNIEIVPINDGCLGSCTFCKTKQARGNLFSYPENEIVRHISKAVEEGAQEIWLTSQDTAAYGKDKGITIVELLQKILEIEREFRLRVGMGNPECLLPFIREFAAALKHQKAFKFVHIPVQSGSNAVLRAMRREYSSEEFRRIISVLRGEIPSITIATDIICGFPGEREQDFQDTLELVREIKFDAINISKFWPRPGTAAYFMQPIDGAIVKQRTSQLATLFKDIALERNSKWIGWKGSILIDERGKNGSSIGRNDFYKQVIVKGGYEPGTHLSVEITGYTSYDLRARVTS